MLSQALKSKGSFLDLLGSENEDSLLVTIYSVMWTLGGSQPCLSCSEPLAAQGVKGL